MTDTKRTVKIMSIDFPSGSTPMTYAETLVRECPDCEWVEEVVYWLNAFLALNKGGDDE